MKEYQPKAACQLMPRAVYMKTIYQIRDYDRLKQKLADLIVQGQDPTQPKVSSGGKTSPVESAAMKRENDAFIVGVIDKALQKIPAEYRIGVWQAVRENTPYPKDADKSTYGRYKTEFIYRVARGLHFI